MQIAPSQPAAVVGYADMLRMTGRLEDARTLLAQALLSEPNHFYLQYQAALTASALRDWRVALPLWLQLKQSQPNNAGLQETIAAALWNARLDHCVSERPDFEIPPGLELTQEQEREVLTNLVGRFESLGDGCEFGMVQRRFGAEPLGLLRWTTVQAETLTRLMETRFEGVGAADNVVLDIWDGEYVTLDKRFIMAGHTFTREAAEPRDRFLSQQRRRLTFLARKLTEDLEGGEKIFVHAFKNEDAGPHRHQLYRSIRAYNVPLRGRPPSVEIGFGGEIALTSAPTSALKSCSWPIPFC